MGSASKLKACHACTSGKRRCDKAQPVCGRCDDKDIECRYPPTKRRRVQAPEPTPRPEATHHDLLNLATTFTFSDASNDLVDMNEWTRSLINWGSLSNDPGPQLPNLEPIQPHNQDPLLSTLQTNSSSPDSQELAPSCQSTSTSTLSVKGTTFFLTPESWKIRHLGVSVPGFSSNVCMNYVRGVHAWFTEWVTSCHSPFIHHQLYADTGFPPPIRDAFSAITLHNTKTPENEEVIDEMLEAKISSLVKSYPDSSPDSVMPSHLDTREHLARSQALFIHLVLALYSPSIGARANAEQHIQTLLIWVKQLWDAAVRDPDLQCPRADGHCGAVSSVSAAAAAAADALFDGDPLPRLWRSWVLSESIRRIWLLTTSTIGLYLTMRQKWAECQGGIMFTTRKALWAAKSASSWAEACRNDDPLFMCSLDGDDLFRGVKAAEVDEMARHLFTIMWGVERVESWISRTAGSEGPVRLWY
ncbi:hypothetical protein FALBO_14408 [Fusarium albosuccineum]|uniref:Zn(2)-C6 fungal-type domain-containing protein n=1 Tax=Fusarium albosuccineum TaxID=1237068 RepID=A0A8H4KYV9_9HYPO|nr:hypothetical protein FALBO_14408 [Fusarium albosuccineum]